VREAGTLEAAEARVVKARRRGRRGRGEAAIALSRGLVGGLPRPDSVGRCARYCCKKMEGRMRQIDDDASGNGPVWSQI
jgi:hypothetical protein